MAYREFTDSKTVMEDGKRKVLLRKEFVCNSFDDLSEMDTSNLLMGSMAFSISDNKVYVLNEEGEWQEPGVIIPDFFEMLIAFVDSQIVPYHEWLEEPYNGTIHYDDTTMFVCLAEANPPTPAPISSYDAHDAQYFTVNEVEDGVLSVLNENTSGESVTGVISVVLENGASGDITFTLESDS